MDAATPARAGRPAFSAARNWGASVPSAYAIQLALGLSLAVSLAWLWHGDAAFDLKAAGLASASLLATPYVLDYDLVVLALTSKAQAIDAQVRHKLRSERLTPGHTSRTERSGGYLLELEYVLRCERSRRAALVRLVSMLGDTPGVRAVRWETAPELVPR